MPFQSIFVNQYQGLNEDENPHALGDSDLTVARNVWRRGRSTGTRPGTQRDQDVYSSDITSTPEVVGLADFRRSRNTNRNLVAIVPGKVYTAPATEVTQTAGVVITNASKELVTTTQHRDILYGAGGDVETSDLPWYYDKDDTLGSGNTDLQLLPMVNLSAAQIRPRWIYHWSNYLFAGGWGDSTLYDNSAGPGIVRYSALNQGTVWPVQNSFGGFSSVGGFSAAGDEFVTGCNSYQDNNGKWLNILTNRAIYTVAQNANPTFPFQLTDKVANGCVNHHAYVNLGLDVGDAVYLSEQGVHSLRQSQAHGNREDAFISFKIRKTFDTINRSALDQAVGAYWRERGLVLFAVPTGSNTKNNLILALDVRDLASGSPLAPGRDLTAENARWYTWELEDDSDHAASVLLSGQDADLNWTVFGGNYKGQVFEFTEDVFSDMGAQYTSEFQTKHYTLGSPFSRKLVGDILVDIQPGGDQRPIMTTVFDFGRNVSSGNSLTMPKSTTKWGPTGTMSWGGSKWGEGDVNVQNLVYGLGSGDSVGWNFKHSGTNEPFYVAQLAAQIDEMGPAADG